MAKLTDHNFDKWDDGSPMIVLFHAPFAGPCNLALPKFENVSLRRGNEVRFGTFDLDDNPDVPERFNVRGVPLYVTIRDHKVVRMVLGDIAESRIEELVDEVMA